MQYHTLGNSNLSVSAIGFGTIVLSPVVYQAVNDEESRQTLLQILDLGINLIDTADIYAVLTETLSDFFRSLSTFVRERANLVIRVFNAIACDAMTN